MLYRPHNVTLGLILFICLTGCGKKDAPQEKPHEWHELPAVNFAIPPYARYLEGYKICLDAGHGGQGHLPDYKRGPTGLREADINLQVAQYLREFLEQVGVVVFMTRTDDSFISIPERSEIANRNSVDFFISLHHNFTSKPTINYTSTWYHQDADDSRASLDLARYIQQSVADALRLPNFPPTGLYSDRLILPSGFGVLRQAQPVAVLCEASFYSNPEEEGRLRDPLYLKREAYGYFMGLARYVAAGFPKGVLVQPEPDSAVETKTPRIQIRVQDGLHERGAWILKRQQVFTNSVQVKLDGVVIPHQYLRDRDLIVVNLKKPLSNGLHTVETELVNYAGNHNLPGGQQFKVAPPAARMKLSAWAKVIPPDGKSYVRITVSAHDRDGLPIADDEPIYAKTSHGRFREAQPAPMTSRENPRGVEVTAETQLSKNGLARFYLHGDTLGVANVEVSYKKMRRSITVRFGKIRGAILQGAVRVHGTENGIADATLKVAGKQNKTTKTDTDGHFFFDRVSPGKTTLYASNPGYYTRKVQTEAASNSAEVIHPELYPIAEGALMGQVFVLDPRYGGGQRGAVVGPIAAANLNLTLAKTLKEMLETAGATVYLIRENDRKIPVLKRVAAINAIKQDGYYLRINHEVWAEDEPLVVASHYPGNRVAEDYLKAVLEQFNIVRFKTPIETVGDSESREIRSTNKIALALEMRTLNHPTLGESADSPAMIAKAAYAIFLGTWQFLKTEPLSRTSLDVQVKDASSKQPISGAKIAIDDTFPLITDRAGTAIFHSLQPRRYRINVRASGYAARELEMDVPNQESVVIELK